ncbi:hypothetical protein C474_16364 [Halogeometricum pallidum JCM 14848]|uniref:PRC-barrel domain-containing protein n=1 Tax=Halogeometricum pallidum JCM 14848 TaxID=1227487 RepID=M0D0A1_HALPD|nr:hypothetical protein [Halogeometricum pallidum]ELZ28092.1 hypothetical protein C474_16364 [Halogeometricum pallidum JCM 14848]
MTRPFSDDDRDKEVLTAEGDRIGRVHDVDGDGNSATVEADESLSEKLPDKLDWTDDDPNEIRREQVDSNTGDYLRLKQKW